LKTSFDYVVRTTSSGIPATATAIGNINPATCSSSLSDFQATASQAQGDCTTIALASDNPGYEQAYINASNPKPAPPLHKVIESAGSGC
jgi:hypothetical protein